MLSHSVPKESTQNTWKKKNEKKKSRIRTKKSGGTNKKPLFELH